MIDTHAEVARRQVELLRAASFERRARLALSLSHTVIELSRRALRERMPGVSEREVLLRWVGQQYGADLEQRLRAHLAGRRG